MLPVSLGVLGSPFLQVGLEEKSLDSQDRLSLLLAQAFPLAQVDPFRANLRRPLLLSHPSDHASHSDRETQEDLSLLQDLASLNLPHNLLVRGLPLPLDGPFVQTSLGHLGTRGKFSDSDT